MGWVAELLKPSSAFVVAVEFTTGMHAYVLGCNPYLFSIAYSQPSLEWTVSSRLVARTKTNPQEAAGNWTLTVIHRFFTVFVSSPLSKNLSTLVLLYGAIQSSALHVPGAISQTLTGKRNADANAITAGKPPIGRISSLLKCAAAAFVLVLDSDTLAATFDEHNEHDNITASGKALKGGVRPNDTSISITSSSIAT